MCLTWWGEAPKGMDNVDEASDVEEFKGHAGTICVPSRGSAMSLLSRFGVTPPNWGPKPRSNFSRLTFHFSRDRAGARPIFCSTFGVFPSQLSFFLRLDNILFSPLR